MSPGAGESPFDLFFRDQGYVLLDGGLATALEEGGQDLNDPLWSARVLLEAPGALTAVHRAYLEAGADCIATATYQATFQGFRARGLDDGQAEEAFHLAVRLAVDARDAFWSDPGKRRGRLRPLVAASIGPYGAYLADGSEYRGDYGLGEEELTDFHRRRWHLLARTAADVLACETVPSALEARVLVHLLDETPDAWAWISFQCRDEAHLADGTPLGDAVAACLEHPRVVAAGVNCVPPQRVPALLAAAGRGKGRSLVAYPNSGERYDAVTKTWRPGSDPVDLAAEAPGWRRLGAAVVGGCCRTTPATIASMRRSLRGT